jgi:Tfp pilus assembly protein PilN
MSAVSPAPSTVASRGSPNRRFQLGIILGSLFALLVAVGGTEALQQKQSAAAEPDLQKEKAKEEGPASDESAYRKYDLALKDLEARINVIQALMETRTGPADFMEDFRKIVNRTGGVGVSRIIPQGNRAGLHGQVRSRSSMAKFLAALQDSGKFSDVQLRHLDEERQQNRAVYTFDLDAVYSPSSVAKTTGESEASPGPNAPGESQGAAAENNRREWFRKLSPEEYSERMEQMRRQVSILRRIVPDEPETEQFLRIILDTGRASGVQIRTPELPQQVPQHNYVELRLAAQVEGAYRSTSYYFKRLARSERIISVSTLSLDLPEKDAVGKYGVLANDSVSVNCIVITYFSKPRPE